MYAVNPKTGAPIRIVTSETSIWRNQKTLVWLDAGADCLIPWNRWDVATTSSATATSLQRKTIEVNLVVALGPVAEEIAWLKSGAAAAISLVAIPRAVAATIGIENLMRLQLKNLVCLEEIGDLYPYTAPWDTTVEDAKRIMGEMMHYKVNHVDPASASGPSVKPRPLWLVTQTYKPLTKKRAEEIDQCLAKNLECPYVDHVVLLNETPIAPAHPKLEEHVVGKRLTYADVIRWIYEKAPAEALVVFANADIYLGDWRTLWSTDPESIALALLRWDVKTGSEPVLFGPRADSQDTWMLSASAVKSRTWDWAALDFPFGQGGCDNAIAVELFRQKFLVVNPALSLKTYHMHESAVRTYDPRDIVAKPMYMHIQPTGIHDLNPVVNLPAPFGTVAAKPFDRRITGSLTATQAKTYAVMATKVSGVPLEATGANTYAPGPLPLFRYENCFQSADGLTYTKDSILIGKTKAAKEAWNKATMSLLSAALKVEKAVVAPITDAMAVDAASYVTNYLGKVLLLRQQLEGDFWCSKAMESALQLFKWPTPTVPVISRDTTKLTWCKEALVWNRQDAGADRVTREEIEALRGALRIQRGVEPRLVVVASDWLPAASIEALEAKQQVTVVWENTALDVLADALVGASGFVTHGPLAAWAWMMPAGATVWEVQSEMAPSIDLLHLCGAAGLKHQLHIVPKGKPTEKQCAAFLAAVVGSARPVIKLPAQRQDMFAHAGDSFREMVVLWEKKGYVDIELTTSGHVWFVPHPGAKAVVLYDRPNLSWLKASPAPAGTRILFGNPEPLAEGSPWSFWPRRPVLVEAFAAREKVFRTKGLVFYGRSENSVQLENRTKENWEPVCDEFVHIEGDKPYPFTQEEYLERLTQAKWGLCLAGFGKKCHREIECMALGCVPVVAPEVDMASYANPPVEGVHYLRVSGPADVAAALAAAAERWPAMSDACREWWRQNASVDGMWELTKRLSSSPPSS